MKIIVNAQTLDWDKKTITYENLAALLGLNPERIYSTTWHISKKNEGGMIYRKEKIKVKKGMVFNMYNTSNA